MIAGSEPRLRYQPVPSLGDLCAQSRCTSSRGGRRCVDITDTRLYNECHSVVRWGRKGARMVVTTANGAARRVQTEAVRREQILTAMRQLIAEQGYERTTTAQIARCAGISEGTIYNYFSSKGAIVKALAEQAQRMTMERAF